MVVDRHLRAVDVELGGGGIISEPWMWYTTGSTKRR